MGNAFSFYQYEGTGVDGVILPTSSPHYTDFTGFYVPPSVIEGKKVGFLWRIFDDYESRAPQYRVKISGEAGNRFNERFNLELFLSGSFSTLVTDSGTYSTQFTGAMVSGWNENAMFYTSPTGNLVTGARDEPTFSGRYSGDYKSDAKDAPTFTTTITGQIPVLYNDTTKYQIGFSGGFSKKDRDIITVGYELSGVSYRIGGRQVAITGSDEVFVNFELSKVIFEFR